MKNRAVVAGLLLSLGLGPALEGQTVPLRTGSLTSSCVFDTTAVRDIASYTFFLAPSDSAAPAWVNAVLAGIAAKFVAPATIKDPLWPGTSTGFDGDESERPTPAEPFAGELALELDRGRVQQVGWIAPPDSPELAAAVLDAVRRFDSLPPSNPSTVPAKRQTLRLSLRTTRKPERIRGAALARLRMPFIRVEEPVSIVDIPTPVFSPELMKHAHNARVDLQYVVMEDGRAAPMGIRVLEAYDSAFAESARSAILAGHFRPARTRGCPVQLLVQQRISYRSR